MAASKVGYRVRSKEGQAKGVKLRSGGAKGSDYRQRDRWRAEAESSKLYGVSRKSDFAPSARAAGGALRVKKQRGPKVATNKNRKVAAGGATKAREQIERRASKTKDYSFIGTTRAGKIPQRSEKQAAQLRKEIGGRASPGMLRARGRMLSEQARARFASKPSIKAQRELRHAKRRQVDLFSPKTVARVAAKNATATKAVGAGGGGGDPPKGGGTTKRAGSRGGRTSGGKGNT